MFLNERQEKELRSALLVTRIIAFALCYGGPLIYALVYAMVVLEGRWSLFFQGFGTVPWKHPLVLGLLTVSATTLAGAFVLPGTLAINHPQRDISPLAVLRARGIVSYAMLEAVAIYGLVLGFVLRAPVATLTLILLAAPPVLCTLMLPREAQWKEWCLRRNKDGHV